MIDLGGAAEVMLYCGIALALVATVMYVRTGLAARGGRAQGTHPA
jgi:hypothetical protein